MRLIEERRGSAVTSYVYEPDSYVPLARLDAEGERTEQGGLGTTQDVQQPQTSKTIAANAGQSSARGQKHLNYSQQPANDTLDASYWQALNPKDTGQSTGTDGPSANANLCEVYYFHTDQVGLPEELSNAQGQIIWQAQYKTWGSTVEERWEARRLHGAKVQGQTEGDIPQGDRQEQNLRFQGQYLDRETGLHYNTFRYYDADIGRFISPDPIGLEGGINLGSYSPNPISWIDPWGWSPQSPQGSYRRERNTHVGGETNHVPPRDAYKGVPSAPSYGQAPAYHMDKADHRGMRSTGSSTSSQLYRAQQRAHILSGRWDLAIEMDIKESLQKFGDKYKNRMQRMVNQAKNLALINKVQASRLSKMCK